MLKAFYRRRMFILTTSLFAYLLVFFQRSSLNVLQADLQSEFALTAFQFSSLSAVYFYLYAFLQIPSGLLVDFMGSRKTSTFGLLLAGFGSLLMALSRDYTWLYVGRLISTIGVAPVFINTLKLNGEWFKPREFMTLTGITLFVGNSGAMLASYPLSWVSSLYGWRTAFVVISLFTMAIAVVAYFVVRDKPSDLGFEDHSLPAETLSLKKTWEGFIQTIKKRVLYFPIFIYAFSFAVVQTLQAAWGARWSQTLLGVDRVGAGFIVMWISLGVMFGALIGGRLADRYGRALLMNIFLGMFAIVWCFLPLALKLPFTVSLLSLWMFLVGFFGSGFSITWHLGKEIAGRNYSGIGMALVNGSGFLLAAVYQLIYGRILDQYRSGDQYLWEGFARGNVLLIVSAILAFTLSLIFYFRHVGASKNLPQSIAK